MPELHSATKPKKIPGFPTPTEVMEKVPGVSGLIFLQKIKTKAKTRKSK